MGWFALGIFLFVAVSLHGWVNKGLYNEIKEAKKKSGLWNE